MKIEDTTRTYLVTTFICSQCGRRLNLSYDVPSYGFGEKPLPSEDEPAGGCAVQQIVTVYPCECTTRPVEEVKRAVKTLLQFGANNAKD